MSASSRPTGNTLGSLGHEVGDDLASLRVGERRDHPARLVQQVVDEARPHGERRAVDLDEVGLHLDAPAEDRRLRR